MLERMAGLQRRPGIGTDACPWIWLERTEDQRGNSGSDKPVEHVV